MYQTGYVGYKIYTRNTITKKCAVNNMKLDLMMSGFKKEDLEQFHGMHQYRIVQKAYIEAEEEE